MKTDQATSPLDFELTRRDMLRQTGLVTVGLAVTPVAGWPATWFAQEFTVVPFTDVPENFTGLRGTRRVAQDLRQLSSWVTPTEDFFVVGHYGYPEVDAAAYRLRVTGLVDRPITLTLDELKARPRVEPTTVFECSGNSRGLIHGMVGNASWAGAALLPLLAEAGLRPDSREVYFWGADTGTEEIRGREYEQNFARSNAIGKRRGQRRRRDLAYRHHGSTGRSPHLDVLHVRDGGTRRRRGHRGLARYRCGRAYATGRPQHEAHSLGEQRAVRAHHTGIVAGRVS